MRRRPDCTLIVLDYYPIVPRDVYQNKVSTCAPRYSLTVNGKGKWSLRGNLRPTRVLSLTWNGSFMLCAQVGLPFTTAALLLPCLPLLFPFLSYSYLPSFSHRRALGAMRCSTSFRNTRGVRSRDDIIEAYDAAESHARIPTRHSLFRVSEPVRQHPQS